MQVKPKCPTCFEFFDATKHIPLCLPCGHTICSNCLDQIRRIEEQGVGCCPMCRTKLNVYTTFTKNFSLLEAFEPKPSKESEDKHSLKNVEVKKCAVHKEKKIKFFCYECEKGICSICFATEHNKHPLVNPMNTREEIKSKTISLISQYKEQMFEAEQIREQSIIEYAKMERRKEEEIFRINGEFERISNLLAERKQYFLHQISTAFGLIAKSLFTELGASGSQVDYCKDILAKLIEFNNMYFPGVKPLDKKGSSGPAVEALESSRDANLLTEAQIKKEVSPIKDSKKEQKEEALKTPRTVDIVTLNKDAEAILPRAEKELKEIIANEKRHPCTFKDYPQFNIDMTSCTEFIFRIGELSNLGAYIPKPMAFQNHNAATYLERSHCVLFMANTPCGDIVVPYNLMKGMWMRPACLQREGYAQEFYKSMVGTPLPTGDIALTGGIEPNTMNAIKRCKMLKRSDLTFDQMQPMLHARYLHCGIEVIGYLYIFGGFQGGEKIKACERLKYVDKVIQPKNIIPWEPITAMTLSRSNFSCCLFDKRTIYVFGGDQSPTLERYNIHLNKWELLPQIKEIDPLLAMSVIGVHRINGTEELALFGSYYLFFFNPKTQSITDKSDFITQRIEHSMEYQNSVVSFTKDRPLNCVMFNFNPFSVMNQTSTIRSMKDSELRGFPAAITSAIS